MGLCLCLFWPHLGLADTKTDIDSLESLLSKSSENTRIDLLNELAWLHLNTDMKQGMAYAYEADSLSQLYDYKKGEAFANGNLGVLFEVSGEYRVAVKYYHRSVQLYEELDDWESVTSILTNLGVLFDQIGATRKALDYYRKSLELVSKYKLHYSLAGNYHNIGVVFRGLGERDSAFAYFNRAVAAEKKYGDPNHVPFYYNSLGNAYSEQGELDTAYSLLKASLRYSLKQSNPYSLGYDYANLADYFVRKRKADSALYYSNLAFSEAKRSGNTDLLKAALKEQTLALELNGNFREALKASQKHLKLRDSLFNANQSFHIAILEGEFQLEKKDEEVQNLTFKNREKEKYLLLISILASLVVVTTSVFVYQNKLKNKKLEDRNVQIEQSLADIKVLARESHHRVKNNLQVISSLLKLQTKHVRSQAAKDSLTEAFNRIRTISLIHQKLYKGDSFDRVKLEEFLIQLAGQVQNSLSQADGILIQVSCPPLVMKVDGAIFIGLIVNELITNSVKYGDMKAGGGLVDVSISSFARGLKLTVQDNGIGFRGLEPEQNNDNFGFKVIRSLLRMFKGELKTEDDNGAKVTVVFNSIEYDESQSSNS